MEFVNLTILKKKLKKFSPSPLQSRKYNFANASECFYDASSQWSHIWVCWRITWTRGITPRPFSFAACGETRMWNWSREGERNSFKGCVERIWEEGKLRGEDLQQWGDLRLCVGIPRRRERDQWCCSSLACLHPLGRYVGDRPPVWEHVFPFHQ